LASGNSKRGHRTRVDKMLVTDGRVRLARAIRDSRQSFLSMCPSPPSPVDLALAERLAITGAQLLELDARALRQPLTSVDARLYVMLSGLHSRLLRQLGSRKATRPAGASLADHLARRAAERGGAAA